MNCIVCVLYLNKTAFEKLRKGGGEKQPEEALGHGCPLVCLKSGLWEWAKGKGWVSP